MINLLELEPQKISRDIRGKFALIPVMLLQKAILRCAAGGP